ncbi:hypothetical protein EYF80_050765 [Liparis tanakae]|uniref:Uncharacterized protein n=1 Tax=Liparis tanakae TaxID=230148 RepID=A0A4Z2FE64_9TELE|nr:hypothetical protein EYF80_050765 [Liparis tanakae]
MSLQPREARDVSPRLHPAHHVLDVLSDLIGGLQTKEVEVPQQVVVKGQELEIQLRKAATDTLETQIPSRATSENRAGTHQQLQENLLLFGGVLPFRKLRQQAQHVDGSGLTGATGL